MAFKPHCGICRSWHLEGAPHDPEGWKKYADKDARIAELEAALSASEAAREKAEGDLRDAIIQRDALVGNLHILQDRGSA